MIGLGAVLLLLCNGRIAGVSGIVSGLFGQADGRLWRICFIGGLLISGALSVWMHWLPAGDAVVSWPWIALGGFLVGCGTQLGRGCTSGHGVCGLGRLSFRSLVASLVFMATGIISAVLLHGSLWELL